MNKEILAKLISENRIEWRKHVLQRMLERNISRIDIKETIIKGEIIEDYNQSKPFPSALFFKVINNQPLHVVAALNEKADRLYIITAYEPDLIIFESDFKTRKKL